MDTIRYLHKQALAVLRDSGFYRFYLLVSMFGVCTLFYYFGELIDFTGWTFLHHDFFYSVHDVHRLFFLVPLVYAGYTYRIRGAVIVTIASWAAFMPRALWISPYPDPTLRAGLYTMFAGLIGILTGMLHNGTEHRSRLEARLRSEKDRMLGMMEMMEEGIILVDPACRIRFINKSMVREFGKGLGSLCYQYLHNFDEPCGEICRLPAVVGGATERWEYTFPNGRTYEVNATPFADSDGVVCQIAAFRNITQRKKVEMELIELNRLKSELLSNVSHELRSPLTSIKGIISSLLQKDIEWDGETRELLLTGMSEETDRLASLVTNLLNMSKIEANVWKPEKERRDVSDVIRETLEQQKWLYKDHIFETELEPGLPEVSIDYNQMKQVLVNLLENAAAYSEKGTKIKVMAKAVDGAVEVSVSDRGIGIPADELDKIFEKFYRGSQTRQKPGGTGLGLAISEAIIHAHRGRIWAESEMGHGSTFYFRLPVAQPGNE